MDAMASIAPDARLITIQMALLGDSTAQVSVSDSGTGIPEQKLSEIFAAFHTTKEQGTGLGLSIAVFRFTLPLIYGPVSQARLAPRHVG